MDLKKQLHFEVGYKTRALDKIICNQPLSHIYDKQFMETFHTMLLLLNISYRTIRPQQQVVTGYTNFSEQEMSGIELEFDYVPYEGVELWLGYLYRYIQITKQWYYGQMRLEEQITDSP